MISARCWSALLWAIALAIGLDEPALAQGTLAEPQAKAALATGQSGLRAKLRALYRVARARFR